MTIDERARAIAERIIGWCNSRDDATILGSLCSELVQVCHDYRDPLDAERIQRESVEARAEVERLTGIVQAVEKLIDPESGFVGLTIQRDRFFTEGDIRAALGEAS